MINLFKTNYDGISKAFWETNYMMAVSMITILIISLPLGIILFALSKDYLLKNRVIYEIVSILLNALRSVPFLIFIFILIPVNRFLFKTSFGNIAAILPLTLIGISVYTRFVEQALINVPKKIIDRAISMGATRMQIIRYFLLPSTIDNLILSFTYTTISLLAYTTVMGVIGAGGLGEYAFRYGYQEYNYNLMYLIVIIFIIYVFIIQSIGYSLAKLFTNKKEK
ncbi:putative D-methionine transport system permease protein MetI [Gemella bergeri ATCC 700627]|uniref:Putative D-methionine transport system permease protein MetI n=1 Tax=Gemella bergeri ATCC 700627 TaxID=1321820 RepID=U2SCL9_9BACL|nr:methionine ABC transporter permease [Gemella bergeri]ERK60452.1 putative D-methionine transport system permease protein MetI [Gemella bergeri ATCC 700627]